MALTLEPGNVYFLRMIDPSGRHGPFPYVKVGITRHKVEDRINGLKTGNPFEIVEHDSFASEAASLIEQFIHRRHADRRVRLEWMRFEEDELPALVTEAREYNAQLGPQIVVIRELQKSSSNGEMREATEAERAHFEEMLPVLRESVEQTHRVNHAKARLQILTGATGGIPGITTQTRVKGSLKFDRKRLEEDHPELHGEYLRVERWNTRFSFLSKPRITEFPELHAEKKKVSEALPDVELELAELDSEVMRTADIEALHNDYIMALAENEEIKRRLQLFEFELCLAVGEHEGIDGICKFTRKLENKFDREAFEAEHPDVANQYLHQEPDKLRFSVSKGRDYA